MRYIFILFTLVALLLTACGKSEPDLPPTLAPADTPTPLNTRILETATPPIPPTWTPSPKNTEGETTLEDGIDENSENVTLYTIQRGDTLTIIAGKFAVSVQKLADVNHISNWDLIEVGETLIIPE